MSTAAERFSATLVDELARNGVRHAALSPGSRSGPLALALWHHPDIEVHVSLDERSAAFLALGTAKVTGAPAVVLCTSGTAAANLAPAVHEAHQSRTPLIALTADRPPELRDTGANQTIDQIKMFGDAVRWFCEIGGPDSQPDGASYWRSLACRAVRMATGSPPGPVHLNAALREPLIETGTAAAEGGRGDGQPWISFSPSSGQVAAGTIEMLAEMATSTRGVVIAGAGAAGSKLPALAAHLGWPLLADPLSNSRWGPNAITTYDSLLRTTSFREAVAPEIVIRAGRLGISKALASYAATAPIQVLIDADSAALDAHRSVTHIVAADPDRVASALIEATEPAGDTGWMDTWRAAEQAALGTITEALSGDISEPDVARRLAGSLPDGANLFVGASMPFRDIESFAPARDGVTYFGNRGANGIDGTVATALGVALASERPTWLLCGDLTLLHDSNALLIGSADVDLTIVVIDNSGGGIFSFLPQAGVEGFEEIFATPQARDLAALAEFHGIPYKRVESLDDLPGEPGGVHILHVITNRSGNVALHRDLQERVAAALQGRNDQ